MNFKYLQRSKMESRIPKAIDPTDTAVDIPGRQPLLHVWLFTSSVDSAGRDIGITIVIVKPYFTYESRIIISFMFSTLTLVRQDLVGLDPDRVQLNIKK